MGIFNFLKKKKIQDLEMLWQKGIDEPAYRLEFLKSMLSEKLVVLTKDGDISEDHQISEKDTKFAIFAFQDGRIPFFTSAKRIFDNNIIKHQVKFLEVEGKNLFAILKGKTLVLNPNSDHTKEFSPEEIERLVDGTYFSKSVRRLKIDKLTPIKIKQPDKYPTEVVKALVNLFSNKPDVNAAYVGWMYDPASDDPPHYIFGIDSRGDWNSLSGEAGFLVNQILGDEMFNLIQMTGQNGIEDYFVKGTKPFYTKLI
jgi:hypothetical protein